MSAERGWIGEPQPQREWHRSIASARADRIRAAQEQRRREILQQVAEGEERRKQALAREPAGEPTVSVPSERMTPRTTTSSAQRSAGSPRRDIATAIRSTPHTP